MNEKTKAALYPRLNGSIMKFKATQDFLTHPDSHLGMTPMLIQMRGEIHCLALMHLKKRREKMAQLFVEEYLQEEIELREVGLAYINTQP